MGLDGYIARQISHPGGWLAPLVARMLNAGNRALNQAAISVLDLQPGLRVLDVGCGCGETTVLAARGRRVQQDCLLIAGPHAFRSLVSETAGRRLLQRHRHGGARSDEHRLLARARHERVVAAAREGEVGRAEGEDRGAGAQRRGEGAVARRMALRRSSTRPGNVGRSQWKSVLRRPIVRTLAHKCCRW